MEVLLAIILVIGVVAVIYMKIIAEDNKEKGIQDKKIFNRELYNSAELEEKTNKNNESISSNVVARKIRMYIMATKIIACIIAVILLIVILIETEDFIMALLVGVGIVAVTWISTLLLEAIAEGLNLLQDIKNKMK